jgi:hypothetical protein
MEAIIMAEWKIKRGDQEYAVGVPSSCRMQSLGVDTPRLQRKARRPQQT